MIRAERISMKQVEGFVTDDGTFYERSVDANYHEALQELQGVLMLDIKEQNILKFIKILEKHHHVIERFFNAVNAKEFEQEDAGIERFFNNTTAESDPAQDAGDVLDSRDDGRGEETAETVQQQSVDGDRPVSHLGRSISAEEIQHRRTELSLGMRKGDARRFRSGEDMATGAQTEPTQTRTRKRGKDHRKA